jgi:hypothetical protein
LSPDTGVDWPIVPYTRVHARALEPSPGPHPAASPYDKGISGTGTVVVDDDVVPIGPGDFIAVTPESARRVRAGDDGLVFIAVCAS